MRLLRRKPRPTGFARHMTMAVPNYGGEGYVASCSSTGCGWRRYFADYMDAFRARLAHEADTETIYWSDGSVTGPLSPDASANPPEPGGTE